MSTIRFRRGTAAAWASVNPILASGEPGYATDTGVLKLGNGTDAWADLDAIGDASGTFLAKGLNLSDLTDFAAARTSLGLGAAATKSMTQIAADPALAASYLRAVRPPLVGDGATSDTAAINTAVAAAVTAGHKTVVIEPNASGYAITRQTSGSQKGGGINLVSGSRLIGSATKLTIKDNCSFINVRGKGPDPFNAVNSLDGTTAVSVITADTAVGDTTVTVTSSTGFTVGDDVIVRLGQAAYDNLEPDWWIFAKVTAKPDSTHITIDRPLDYAMTVASTTNQWNRVIGVVRFVEDVYIDGFVLENTMVSGNAESGIDMLYARRVTLGTISGTNPGAGLVAQQFCDDVKGRMLHVPQSRIQSAQASKGRVISIAECRNVRYDLVHGADFEGAPVVVEGRCQNVVIDNLSLENTYAGRTSTLALLGALGNGQLKINQLLLTGLGAPLDNAVSDASFYNIGHLSMRTATTCTISDLSMVKALTINGLRYRKTRTVSRAFQLVPSGYAIAKIPDGLIRSIKAYVSTKTGIVYSQVTGSAGGSGNTTGLLAAGETRDIGGSPAAITGYGTGYAVNAAEGSKQYVVQGDGTIPANSWGRIEVEMFQPAVAAAADDHGYASSDSGDILVLRSQDANTSLVKRDPANGDLVTPSKLRAASLGVGNSAAATTPGTVVKKVQLFDASGASIGYVPVYDAIS